MASATFTADTTTNMPNPERGHYFRSSVQPMADPAGFNTEGGFVFNGQTLSGGAVVPPARLMHFYQTLPTSGTITAQDLTDLATSFGFARTRGLKLIGRFNYGTANPTTEATLSDIQAQMAQLAPVLASNRDVLCEIEAGFIGSFGEWVGSGRGLDSQANILSIKNALLGMVPPEIPVRFTRFYPMQETGGWFSGQPAITAAEAFNGSEKARMGFHSDCFLTGQGDSSFHTGPTTINGWTIVKTRFEQRSYIKTASEFLPFGGEMCNGSAGAGVQMRTAGSGSIISVADGGASPNGDPGGILVEGPAYHVSCLNRSIFNFWDAWIAEGATISTVYRQLGYRFQFDSITHADSVARGATLLLRVNMRNVGWARIFSARRLGGRVTNGASVATGYSSSQLRQLPSQAISSTTVLVPIVIPAGFPIGNATISLTMEDIYPATSTRREYKIQPANSIGLWDDVNGRYNTTTSVTVT